MIKLFDGTCVDARRVQALQVTTKANGGPRLVIVLENAVVLNLNAGTDEEAHRALESAATAINFIAAFERLPK